jgi:hypothetical protein
MNISIQVSIYIVLSSVFTKLLEISHNSRNIIIIMSVYNVLAKDDIAGTQSQLEPRVVDDTEASSCPVNKLQSTGKSSVAFSKLGKLESPAIKQDTMPDCELCDSVSKTIVSSALGNGIDQLTEDSREYHNSSLDQVAVAAAVLRRQNSVSNSFSGVDLSDWSDDDINYSPLLDEISKALPLAASDLKLSLNADLYSEGIYSDTECIQQLAYAHHKVLLKSNVEWLQTNQNKNNDQVVNVCGNIDSFHADSNNAAGEKSKWSLPENDEYCTELQCHSGNYEFDLLPIPARLSLGGEHFCTHMIENRIEKHEKLFLIPTDINNDFLISPQTLELKLISDSLVSEQVHIAPDEEEIEVAAVNNGI